MRFGPELPGLVWEERCSEAVVDSKERQQVLHKRHKRDEDLEGVINYESLKGELDYLMGANC